jgi:hypothetical protein
MASIVVLTAYHDTIANALIARGDHPEEIAAWSSDARLLEQIGESLSKVRV